LEHETATSEGSEVAVSDTKIEKYGLRWPADLSPVAIEMTCIQHGGRWSGPNGVEVGAGIFEHFRNMQKLLWP
jgi:hypothetical protein